MSKGKKNAPMSRSSKGGPNWDINSVSHNSKNFNIPEKFNVSMLQNVKGADDQYTAQCPAHDDRHNSLSVKITSNKVLLHCHAGCSVENILNKLNLPFSSLFLEELDNKTSKLNSRVVKNNSQGKNRIFKKFILPQNEFLNPQNEFLNPQNEFLKPQNEFLKPQNEFLKPQNEFLKNSQKGVGEFNLPNNFPNLHQNNVDNPNLQQIKTTLYEYHKLDGSLAYRKTRFEYSNGTKSFAFQSPNGKMKLTGLQRVPYNLPAVISAQTVYFVEGEKAANAIINAGRTATTLDAGANSKWLPEYTEYFKGKDVVILPDNDEPGMAYAHSISKNLPGSIIIKLPGLPKKGDVYDWLAAGHTMEEIDCLPFEVPETTTRIDSDLPNFLPNEPGFIAINPFRAENVKYRYRWDDIGISNLFADCYKNISRFIPEANSWYIYNGQVWQPDVGNILIANQVKKFMYYLLISCQKYITDDNTRTQWTEFVLKRMRKQARDTMIEDATSVWPISITKLDRDPYIFNCQNCTLDLRTFTAHAHNPDDFLSKVSNVIYDEKSRCDRWETFISEIMMGNEETARFLQKALGYALTGDTSEECFFILYGNTTRNGKGTTMETALHMLGDYSKTAQPETIAQKQITHTGGPTEDIARLKGARFVNMSEPDKGLRLNSALVKQVTGGDTVTARFLHQNSFEYRPEYKLFINTNHLPRVSDDTIFASGRVKLIPFERHFTEGEQDKSLKDLFKRPENVSGIFNWFLEGLQLMHTEGLDQPESVRVATAQYREESDIIRQFITDCMTNVKGMNTKADEVYREYKQWCEECGYGVKSSKTFYTDLRAKGIRIERTRQGQTIYEYALLYRDSIPTGF